MSSRVAGECPRCGAPCIGGACLACLRKRVQTSRRVAGPRPRRTPPRRSTRVAGVDLDVWLAHFAALRVFGGPDARLVTHPPALHVRRASKPPRRRLAFASYDRHLIHLTAYPGIRPAQALETLLHEVVHLQALENRRHDAHFKRTLALAALEAFGVDCRSRVKLPVYRLDVAIVEALEQRGIPDATGL